MRISDWSSDVCSSDLLRPEPGNAVTAAAVAAMGLMAIRLPLFEVRAIAWAAPDPGGFDALVLTSANAVRLGGIGLDRFKALPVHAVGGATAAAAAQAGFSVVAVGEDRKSTSLNSSH